MKIIILNKWSQLGINLVFLLLFVACSPSENDDYSLGKLPQESDLSFSMIPEAGKPNRVVFQNTSLTSGIAIWEFGNGSTAKGNKVTSDFPFSGDYSVKMTLYTTGGHTAITQSMTIANDDMSMLDTPMYRALTGGPENLQGKTWVFDQYHTGHFAVGPADSATPSWWECPPNGKLDSSLYTQEFTFIQVGVQMIWKNNGYVYTNAAGKDALGGTAIVPPESGDFDVEYVVNSNYNFTLDEANNTLSLSNNAFFGHYSGASTYEIISLTENEMYLKALSTVEPGNGWWYRLIPKELNVEPVDEVKIEAHPFMDDMEDETAITYEQNDMGDKAVRGYNNPAPIGLNTSSKVYLYEKSEAFYTNLTIPASYYKFDLTDQHIIKMKVFIPSYNDYVTTGDVAGSWISINQLQKTVAVKLQDSDQGGNAWQTQVEVKKINIPTDQWVELTFDFSSASTRQDLDQIIVQFGDEGHNRSGIFFFDDLSFDVAQ
jgi:hypothetical protein